MPVASSTTAAMSSALIRSPSSASAGTANGPKRPAVDDEELLLGAEREGRALAEGPRNHRRDDAYVNMTERLSE